MIFWRTFQNLRLTLKISVGVHPTSPGKLNPSFIDRFLELLISPEFVLSGRSVWTTLRVPLHQSRSFSTICLVGLCQLKDPLFLYCRDKIGDWVASRDAMEIVSRHFPHTVKLHSHCFVGGLDEYQIRMVHLPCT